MRAKWSRWRDTKRATEIATKSAKDDLTTLRAGLVSPGHEGAHYEVRVRLDDAPRPDLVIGGRGEAKVATERVTLARRISRYLAQTFRLPI